MSEETDCREEVDQEQDEVGELIRCEERREEEKGGERNESLEGWEIGRIRIESETVRVISQIKVQLKRGEERLTRRSL